MRPPPIRRHIAALAVVPLAGLACAPRAAVGGDAGGLVADAASPMLRSYNLTATMTFDGDLGPQGRGAGKSVPTTSFAVALDATGRYAIIGGGTEVQAVDLARADAQTFDVKTGFAVDIAAHACDAPVHAFFDALEFTIVEGVVTGSGTGDATVVLTSSISRADVVTVGHFSASITGEVATTAPFLLIPPGAEIADPLSPFVLWASAPLSAGATASVVGSDGSRVTLVPQVVPGAMPVVVAFSKPNVVLAPGLGYQVDFTGITDLAGHEAPPGSSVRLASFDAGPLVPQDGFESATGASVGGAALVTAGSGVSISGTTSVYIGQFNSPAQPGLTLHPRLTLRLAVPAGATKLTFSYRELSNPDEPAGVVELGSVGHAATAPAPIPPMPASAFTLRSWGSVESLVGTMELALPNDVTDEIVVGIQSPPVSCNAGFGTVGLVLDDLRLE